MPFQLTVSVYNSAGELVAQVYQGQISVLPQSLALTQSSFIAGTGITILDLPGLVTGPNGTLVSGSGGAVSWNGTNGAGQPVQSGVYYVKIQLTNAFGQVTSYTNPVDVIAVPTTSWLIIDNAAGEVVWRQQVNNGANSLSLPPAVAFPGVGQATSGKLGVSILVSGTAGAQSVPWNGENLSGRPVSSGLYTAELVTQQAGGTTQVETVKFQILDGPAGNPLSAALLAPNPAVHVQKATLLYDPAFGAATATLFNLAGERVCAGDDPGLTGSLDLDLGRASAGVYVCAVSQGNQVRLLKLAVVR
jgi:hypothetical protein